MKPFTVISQAIGFRPTLLGRRQSGSNWLVDDSGEVCRKFLIPNTSFDYIRSRLAEVEDRLHRSSFLDTFATIRI
jgi:hypothetical protein